VDNEIGQRLGVATATVVRYHASQGLPAYAAAPPNRPAGQLTEITPVSDRVMPGNLQFATDGTQELALKGPEGVVEGNQAAAVHRFMFRCVGNQQRELRC
jgi:hypothetical protein